MDDDYNRMEQEVKKPKPVKSELPMWRIGRAEVFTKAEEKLFF